MTDDIVTRLRRKYAGQLPICTEAADEIERLRAELKQILDVYTTPGIHPEYHEYVKTGLKKEWPALWRALEQAKNV